MTVTIYHNPRCSKSRQTLALIEEKGVVPNIIEYLKDGPDAQTLASVLTKLGKSPREILRKGEQEFKDLGLGDATKTDEELIAAMVAHPILIERPIVIAGDKAALGRPPEQVLDIL